ncbi:hypothetical protein LXL04_000603 [Taraxacum kok-saghyz]
MEMLIYTLQAITILGLLSNNIQNRVDQLSTFSIMSLRPIVTGTRLTKNKVIRPEDLSICSRSETVHRPWLQIHEHRAWNKPPATGLVVINIDPLKLKLGVSGVLPGHINTVLGANNLPELSSDLSGFEDDINSISESLNYYGTPAIQKYWMIMPDTGHPLANVSWQWNMHKSARSIGWQTLYQARLNAYYCAEKASELYIAKEEI